jgi:hypothetical protein
LYRQDKLCVIFDPNWMEEWHTPVCVCVCTYMSLQYMVLTLFNKRCCYFLVTVNTEWVSTYLTNFSCTEE